jgi:tight adherence protein C
VSSVLLAVALWVGSAALLSGLAPVRRPSLAARILPYLTPASAPEPRSLRHRLIPLTLLVGDRLGVVTGTVEPLALRLRRAHADLDPAAFRFRQVSHATLALGVAGMVAMTGRLPPAVVLPFVFGLPVLVFLAHEQVLAAQARARRRRVQRELPVVAEQLAMLLASGTSVPAALRRLAERGEGASADDLAAVTRQIAQGVGEHDALRAWADLSGEPGVSRLVGVLTLDHEATDLDRLVEQEADAIRTEVHRRLLDDLERRGQQVWVPVTVATLLPGSLLLLVPFLDALRVFAAP